MDNDSTKPAAKRVHGWWFRKKRKHKKRSDPFYLGLVTDGGEDHDNDEFVSNSISSTANDPCPSINELKVFVGTWNLGGRSPSGCSATDIDEWLNLKDAADIYIIGFQEIVPLVARNVIGTEDLTVATNWSMLIGQTLNPTTSDGYQYLGVSHSDKKDKVNRRFWATPGRNQSKDQNMEKYQYSRYKLIASKKMVGIFVSVWIKREIDIRYHVSNVRFCSVACGIMGRLGNKGSVSVSLSIEGTTFCFIVAHLASGEKKGDEGRRNHQVSEIFKRTSFPRLSRDNGDFHPPTILGHDRIFWFGDLNYRLYLEDNSARQLIKKEDWMALQKFDQLRKELEDGGTFHGWKEGNIEFAPTYKYSSSNCNRYSGGLPSKAGEKQRTPAWCDRILWYGKGVKPLSYFRGESKFSDHRPVSALFMTQIEDVQSQNAKVVPYQQPILPDITSSKLAKSGNKEDGSSRTLMTLLKCETETS
ncbi:type I inositol polyphosphate 5-phosphatase 4-like [Impatiens glandulifera]|uniref:type I inositol polyphosphate 5-phosphatase 4-like n=1 Tax=Impatiens glandulifera TaxID=253017 RepID=UPI001FB054FB|nr:type I inositol polyphosphate 5-phosphatase 4-like [Impatiens glandulifera]